MIMLYEPTTPPRFTEDFAKKVVLHTASTSFMDEGWEYSDEAKDLNLTKEELSFYKYCIESLLKEDPKQYPEYKYAVQRISSSFKSIAYRRLYDRYKQTYEINEDFFNALIDTNNAKVYVTDLGHMPYESFRIDMSKCPVSLTDDLCVEKIYVTPMWYELNITRQKIFGIFILYECDGDASNYLMISDFIKASDDELFEEVSENGQILQYWEYNDANHDAIVLDHRLLGTKDENGDLVEWAITGSGVEDIHKFIFQFVLYLSSSGADIVETKYSIRQKDRLKRLNKSVSSAETVSVVGKRYGEAIENFRKNRRFYDKIRTISSSTKRPHMVRAHWHHFWRGSGNNKELFVKWLDAYATGNGHIDEVIHPSNSGNEKGSKGEQLVRSSLKSMNIDFTEQFYVPEIGKLYDFAIIVNDTLCFVEFDGEQHFRPVQNWDFERTIKSDLEKDEFAQSHRIPMLRIRYDQITDIKDILGYFTEIVIAGEYDYACAFYNVGYGDDYRKI